MQNLPKVNKDYSDRNRTSPVALTGNKFEFRRFEKNGYSQGWHEESAKIGLPNVKNTPQALKLFLTDDVIKVFSKYNILTERELRSKIEIKLETYLKTKEIEYKYAVKVVNTLLLPAILKQINLLAKANENLSKFNIKPEIFSKEFETLIKLYDDIKKYCILDNFLAADHSDITATTDEFSSKGPEILTKF